LKFCCLISSNIIPNMSRLCSSIKVYILIHILFYFQFSTKRIINFN
jgi:hypothetical protein